MSLGSWDPAAESAAYHQQIEPATLDRFIAYSRDDHLDQLDQLIQGDESQIMAGLMLIEHSAWLEAAESRPDEDLLHLIRAKALRKRGTRLDKDLLRWLREVSDNRFLPYGPL
jgi:hypothetical protein